MSSTRPGGRVLITRVAGDTGRALIGRDYHMAKTAKKKAFKATPATSRRTRGDVVKQIAEATELKPGKVREVFETLTALMAADLGKKGCGEFNFNGLMKLKAVNKPATPARKGRNPFTGEEIMIKAKPASRKVRVRALRTLNGMI
jgi:nucleoid DNA-binding protein